MAEDTAVMAMGVMDMVVIITTMYGSHGGRRSSYWYDGYEYSDSDGGHSEYGQNGYGGRYGGYVEYKPWKLTIFNLAQGITILSYADPLRVALLAMVAMAMVSMVMAHPEPGYGHGGYGYGGHGGGHGGYGYGGHGGGHGGYGGYGHGGGHEAPFYNLKKMQKGIIKHTVQIMRF
ncbi:shematrin-like protein 2 [Penaeus monodon]|uniref:shematrin-like protein 2 n=1 Tax=Penaeus monodon TaxID=6687 RepID=UPI0018A79D02|nr:shematrin-like protein 2 [Penaeus monodon]